MVLTAFENGIKVIGFESSSKLITSKNFYTSVRDSLMAQGMFSFFENNPKAKVVMYGGMWHVSLDKRALMGILKAKGFKVFSFVSLATQESADVDSHFEHSSYVSSFKGIAQVINRNSTLGRVKIVLSNKAISIGTKFNGVILFNISSAMTTTRILPQARQSFGGIDLNSANLAMVIKRDGKGVVLPMAQQDMAQLSNFEGLDPKILSIKPASQTSLFSQLQTSP